MTTTAPYEGRSLRLCHLSLDSRVVDRGRRQLESHLARLGAGLRIDTIKSLDDPALFPCDLLLVDAHHLDEEAFPVWLRRLSARIRSAPPASPPGAQRLIWTPALILAAVDFSVLLELWPEVTADNWYFDIVTPEQMDSLPLRVANLLRIHDHLHELGRYETALGDLEQQVRRLGEQVEKLRRPPSAGQKRTGRSRRPS